MSSEARKLLSIVCPVFNEEDCVVPFYERLREAIAPLLDRYDYELIFTNNRSTDATAERVRELRAGDGSVQLLTFSKNFGYQESVLAGMKQARGDAIVVIDVDCEDPPEMIPDFVERWEEGFDVVYGERRGRQEPFVVTFMRRLFYRLNRLVADNDIVLDMAEFSLITRPVRDAVVSNKNTFPFLRAEIARYGFSRVGLPYDRQPRIHGRSHYNLLSMTKFAVAGILSSTTAPLRMALYFLPLLVIANAVLLIAEIDGWWPHSVVTLVAVDGTYLATWLAFSSLFVARLYHNTIGRPGVVVDWRNSATNAEPEQSPNTLTPPWKDE